MGTHCTLYRNYTCGLVCPLWGTWKWKHAATSGSYGNGDTPPATCKWLCWPSEPLRTWDGAPRWLPRKYGNAASNPKTGTPPNCAQGWENCASPRRFVPTAINGRCSRWRRFPSRASYVWEKQRCCDGEGSRVKGLYFRTAKNDPRLVVCAWELGRVLGSSGWARKDG